MCFWVVYFVGFVKCVYMFYKIIIWIGKCIDLVGSICCKVIVVKCLIFCNLFDIVFYLIRVKINFGLWGVGFLDKFYCFVGFLV